MEFSREKNPYLSQINSLFRIVEPGQIIIAQRHGKQFGIWWRKKPFVGRRSLTMISWQENTD